MSSSSSQQPARSFAWTLQSPVFVTCVITFLHSVAFGLVAADAVDLLTYLVKGDLSRAAYLTSWLEATMAALQFIFNPVCGSLSDRWGRRPFILLSLFGTAIEFWLIAWFASIPILILGAILRGLTGVTYTLTSTVAIDASKNNLDLSANIGLIGAATGLGFIFGAIGGIGASRVSLFFPFVLAGIITFFNTFFAWIWLVDVPIEERERGVVIDDDAAVAETRDTSTYQQDSAIATTSPTPAGRLLYVPHAQSATVVVSWNPFSPLRLLIMSKSLFWLSVAYWLTLMARAIVKIWFLYTKYRYHWDAATNGIFIAYVGICLIIAQGLMLRYLVGKFGEHHLIFITISMSVLASMCFGVAWKGWQLFVLQSIFGWNYVLIPVLRGVISHHVLPEHQGTLQGALAALVTSATLLGSFIFAQLFGYFTSTSTPIHLPGVPFFLSALLHLISLIFVYIAYRYINANTTYVQIASNDDENPKNNKKIDVDDVEEEHDDHQPLLGEKEEHVRERGNKISETTTQVPFTTVNQITPTRVPATSILRVTIPCEETRPTSTSRVQFVPLPSHLHTDRRPSELTIPVIATTPIPPSDDDTRQHEEEMIAAIMERQQRQRRHMMQTIECSG